MLAGTGHLRPLIPFAKASLKAGDEVLVVAPESSGWVLDEWLSFRPCASLREEREARFTSFSDLPLHEGGSGMGMESFRRLHPRAALAGMRAAIDAWRPDVVVREAAEMASLLAAEQAAVPTVQVAASLAPFHEVAMQTATGLLARLRNEAGLREPDQAGFRSEPYLTLAPASLGPPDNPHTRRFKMPQRPPAGPAAWLPPGDAPLVYVSLGPITARTPRLAPLYRTAVAGLASLPIRIIVALGGADPAELGEVPAHVRIERWVPQEQAMLYSAAMVSHGGFGSVIAALAGGVPLAVVPVFADLQHNAVQLAATGAGIAIDGPAAIGTLPAAVTRLIDDRSYRDAAERTAAQIAAQPPVDGAATALHALVNDQL